MIFLSWPDSGRSSTGRFLENCAPRKTLQLSLKLRNNHAFAVPKTANYAISCVFCNLFRFPTFASKWLCDKLANSIEILVEIAKCVFFVVNILHSAALTAVRPPARPPARQPSQPASQPGPSSRHAFSVNDRAHVCKCKCSAADLRRSFRPTRLHLK